MKPVDGGVGCQVGWTRGVTQRVRKLWGGEDGKDREGEGRRIR